MRNKYVNIITLATCLAFQAGCINISDEAMADFGEAIGHGIGEIVKDVQTLSFTTSWYYSVYEKWPSNFTELKEFIAERDAPVNLDRYEDVQFEPKEDGSVECIYKMTILDRNHSGRFVLNVDDVEEINLDMIELDGENLHVEPPKKPEHVQSELSTPFTRLSLAAS